MTTAATAATQYITVNGDSIAYRKIGHGRTILLANRLRGTLDTWDPLFLDQLSAHNTVITFDYPGIGYSSGKLPQDMGQLAAFVRDLARALDIGRFVMGGWSWGGAVAQSVVADYPELVSHALLIATNPAGHIEQQPQPAFLERAFKPVNDLADEEVLFFEPNSARSLQAAKASRERIHAAHPDLAAKIPSTQEEIMQYIPAVQGFHADAQGRREALGRSKVPMLILAGDHDISTAAANWFPLSGKLPTAQMIVLPDSGHAPQHQYPELAARYIDVFLG